MKKIALKSIICIIQFDLPIYLFYRIASMGVVSFLSIFETHPESMNSFLPQVELDSLAEMKMDKL